MFAPLIMYIHSFILTLTRTHTHSLTTTINKFIAVVPHSLAPYHNPSIRCIADHLFYSLSSWKEKIISADLLKNVCTLYSTQSEFIVAGSVWIVKPHEFFTRNFRSKSHRHCRIVTHRLNGIQPRSILPNSTNDERMPRETIKRESNKWKHRFSVYSK